MIVNFLTEKQIKELSSSQVNLDRVAVLILSGGEGTRLSPLTKSRCKPAISFGGRYSLIDVPISHSLTSGLSNIFVIGQYLAYTLQKHLVHTYLDHGISQKQIQMLVPEQREGGEQVWFRGTADAIRKNLNYFTDIDADYFLILSGDQLYNINFQEMIEFGVERDANMVIAAQPVRERDATRMGLLKIEEGGSSLIDFFEKPKEQEILDRFYTDDFTLEQLGCTPKENRHHLGSMGIYFFKRDALIELLEEDDREDFGKHLINTQMQKGGVHAYLYDGYWEDIGTIESYYEANLALAKKSEGLRCYDESSLIITKRYNLPGAKISDCQISESLICEGAVLEGAAISNSVIGVRSVIAKGSVIKDSILMGNEFYEGHSEPRVGENCLIEKAIIDENVTIGNGVRLTNEKGYVEHASEDGKIVVRDGIIIVPKGTTLPDNYSF